MALRILANMAKSTVWIFASVLLAISPGLSAQGPAAERTDVPFGRVGSIQVDGRLEAGEWGKEPTRRLADARSIWNHAKRRKWASAADFSVQLWLRHDGSHIYLAGRVRDDHHVPVAEGADLETGDSIEVFFDVPAADMASDEGEELGHRLGKEDVQLFLLPLTGNWFRRPWDRDEPGARPTPTGSELEGLRLAAHRIDATTYTFEARIAMHNFLPDGREFRELGFQIAFNDRDPSSETVHYVTWNGQNPTLGTNHFVDLAFDPPLMQRVASGVSWNERLATFLPWGVVGLLVLITILFFSRRAPLVALSARQGRVLRVLGVALLVLGLLLPGFLLDRQTDAEAQLDAVTAELQEDLPRMSKGTLTSYVGEARDQPLFDVLTGKAIKRKQSMSYRFLSEMAADKAPRLFGKAPRSYPEEGFPVRPYWLPLPSEQPQTFAWPAPLESGRLYFVLSPVDFGFLELPSPTLSLTYRLRDGQEQQVDPRDVELGDARVSAAAFGKTNRDLVYVSDAPPAGTTGVGLTISGEVPLELVGITLVPDDPDAEPRPLVLGQALGEVASDLRGVYPRDAGFELTTKGESNRVEIPSARVRAFDKLWLVYSATYPVLFSTEPATGEIVCEVHVKFDKGPPQVIPLRHQESMFYALSSRNSEDVAPGVPAVQAEVGEDEGEDKLVNVVYRVDLKSDRRVRGLEFKSHGQYPVRFRSVIFGYQRSVAPPEPSDSPLVAAGPGQVKLQDERLDALDDARFAVFRNGSLVTANLSDADRERHAEIPAPLQDALLRGTDETVGGYVDAGDTRYFRRFVPFDEEGGVLGVFTFDEGFGDRRRWFSLVGVLLCCLSIPLLLLLFNDGLALLTNLRLRLMAVVSIAAVVPMAVLFILLVRTLEGDHDDEQRRTVRQAVRTASDQLKDRQAKLLESAKSHVTYLREVETAFCAAEQKPDKGAVERIKEQLRSAMKGQRDWKGGFMKLEYDPTEKGAASWLSPFTVFDAESDQLLDTPLRDQPAIYVGKRSGAFLGVRYEKGPMSLSIARPIDADLLDEISGKQPTVLCYTSGYPMTGTLDWLRDSGFATALRDQRAAVRDAAQDSRDPVFQRHRINRASWIAAYDVLRDAQDTPRALLGVLQRDAEASLTLANHRVPVRTFFVVMAGLLLVLALALAAIVTGRITAPIERLEHGAEALRRGEFDVRIESHEGGQLGRLTETFNNMAQDLRGRIHDLHLLNRGVQELTSGLDLDQVLASAIAFFTRHSPADRVRILLLDRERDRAEVFGDERVEIDPRAPDVAELLAGTESRIESLAGKAQLLELFPDHHSMIVLPLVLAGRSRGAVLLLFEATQPPEVNRELLETIAAQTSAAVQNARLYHHAVEDLYTGAFVPDYFSRLVGHAVATAQAESQPLSLVAVRLSNGDQQEEALGAEGFGRYMERVASTLRGVLPPNAAIGRATSDAFHVLLPEVGRGGAAATVTTVRNGLLAPEADLGLRGATELELASVSFPAEGASAEFLFHALDSKLRVGDDPEQPGDDPATDEAGVVFNSSVMAEVVRVLRRVAPSDLTILLDGETGTGKEVLTNLIHKWSKRAKGPLVKVHCAALSESLLQSELFGHEKGAFTGATERRIGKFEQADGGTIFLDEIGEVSLDTQVKLLRVLQEREVDRVGGTRPVAVDVRVVAATNRDIEAMVALGTFREDLYYRLQGMVVTVPPLRERKAEIPALLEMFRKEAVSRGHTAVTGFTTDAMDEMFRRDWPGNIRELRNAAFRAMVLAGEGLMERSHILGILPQSAAAETAAPASPGSTPQTAEPTTKSDSPPTAPAVGPAEAAELPTYAIPRPAPAAKKTTPRLSPRLTTLLALIRDRGSLSNQEYVEVARVSPRTGLRDLKELLDLGLIRREGRRRGARYHAISEAELLQNSTVDRGE